MSRLKIILDASTASVNSSNWATVIVRPAISSVLSVIRIFSRLLGRMAARENHPLSASYNSPDAHQDADGALGGLKGSLRVFFRITGRPAGVAAMYLNMFRIGSVGHLCL